MRSSATIDEIAQPEPKRLRSWPISCARLGHDLVSAPDERISHQRATRWVAVLTGTTFVIAGLVKFVFNHGELHTFRSFGLPWSAALEMTLFLLVRGVICRSAGE